MIYVLRFSSCSPFSLPPLRIQALGFRASSGTGASARLLGSPCGTGRRRQHPGVHLSVSGTVSMFLRRRLGLSEGALNLTSNSLNPKAQDFKTLAKPEIVVPIPNVNISQGGTNPVGCKAEALGASVLGFRILILTSGF